MLKISGYWAVTGQLLRPSNRSPAVCTIILYWACWHAHANSLHNKDKTQTTIMNTIFTLSGALKIVFCVNLNRKPTGQSEPYCKLTVDMFEEAYRSMLPICGYPKNELYRGKNPVSDLFESFRNSKPKAFRVWKQTPLPNVCPRFGFHVFSSCLPKLQNRIFGQPW